MMNERKAVFVSLLISVVCVCVSCAVRPDTRAEPHPQSSASFDRDFLQSRIHYYEEQSTMTQLCTQKAERSELNSFCETISKLQPDRSASLQEWLQNWYSSSPTAAASREEHSSEYFKSFASKARSATGSEFESAILSALRLHHHHGIDDLESCVAKANHSELKQWCSLMLFEEKREINQMTIWICSWLKDCIEKPLPE
jgi:uncharacterized protein (DUF305 family)